MTEKKVVTITTLARKLGVSTATVTKALNGQGRISEATVQRVRELAKELKYVPNLAARSLRTNIKDAVGILITSDIINPWYSQLTSILESELSKRGLTMLLALGKGSPERIEHALDNFFGGRVRGIIAGPISNAAEAEILRSAIDRQIPLIIFSNLEKLPLNFVALDQAAGGRIMLEHLYQLGHRKIAYLGALPPRENEMLLNRTRSAAYVDFMDKYDLEPQFLSYNGNYGPSRRAAYDLMNHLLKITPMENLPTAIL
jgi:LacI family transcriptional regulator